VVETSSPKLLWDFSLATDYTHAANCLEIVLLDLHIYFVEEFCPADVNVRPKENEKNV